MNRSDRRSGHRLHARPVFLDRSGQRRRRFVVIGGAVAAALAASLAVLIIGFMGTSSGHVPGFPDAERPAAPAGSSPSVSPMPGTTRSSSTPSALKPTTTPSPTSASPSPKRHTPTHPPRPSKSH